MPTYTNLPQRFAWLSLSRLRFSRLWLAMEMDGILNWKFATSLTCASVSRCDWKMSSRITKVVMKAGHWARSFQMLDAKCQFFELKKQLSLKYPCLTADGCESYTPIVYRLWCDLMRVWAWEEDTRNTKEVSIFTINMVWLVNPWHLCSKSARMFCQEYARMHLLGKQR